MGCVGADVQGRAADPGHGNEGKEIVGGITRIDCGERESLVDEIAVTDHRALGQARGSRSVTEHGDIVTPALGDDLVETLRVSLRDLSPQGFHIFEIHQPGFIVMPHAPLVPIDHLLDPRNLFLDLQQLVALLLIPGQHKRGVGMVNHIFHFFGRDVGENADHGRAHGHDGQRAPKILAIIVADDGHPLAPVQTQLHQAQAKISHMFVFLVPGEALPDAQVFLPRGHFVGPAILLHMLEPVLGQGFRGHGDGEQGAGSRE